MEVLGSCGVPGEGLGLQGSPGVGREDQPRQQGTGHAPWGWGWLRLGGTSALGQEDRQGAAVAGQETASHGWGRTG